MSISGTPGRVERTEGEGSLSKDLVFTVLSNRRRRHVIGFLKQRGERVTIRELSRQVAAWENGVEADELDYKQRKRVYTSLHQTHLPKLADAGVVNYDRDRGTVALDDRARDLEVYMEADSGTEFPWNVFYLGLAALSLAFVSLAWLDVFPFAGVPDAALGAVVAGAFAVSAALQTYLSGDV